jgi:hypothetical protein
VCEFVSPLSVKTQILVLQHPQEPGVEIGTVPILQGCFPRITVRTGLSWPNLKKVLGREVENQRWGVLYLGSVRVEDLPAHRPLFVVDRKGTPRLDQDEVLKHLEGIVVLDGTWSQAKTLWWRNAWLLKLSRLVLKPSKRSLYDRIRKEPRRGCLSTVESVAEVLSCIEKRPELMQEIEKPLSELVNRLDKGRPFSPNRRARHPRGQRRG